MCEPMTALKIGMSLMSTMMAQSAEQDKVDEENQRRRDLAIRTRNEADRSARLELEQVANRESEEAIARSIEGTKAQKDSLRASAAAKVSAAEGGVSGVSVDSLISDYNRNFAEFNHQLDITEEFQRRQSSYDTDVVDHKRQSRYDNSTPSYLDGPSAMGAIGGLAGSAIGAYGKWKASQTPVATTRTNSWGSATGQSGYTYLEV